MLLSLIYDISLLCLGIIALPRLVWQRIRHGKYKSSWRERVSLQVPKISAKKPVIWIHVVSVGETRAIASLYAEMRKNRPNATFVITSVTETGHAEAKRTLPGASAYLFLPLDFSWLMKRFVARIRPDLLLLVEGELWYHLLKYVKRGGGEILLLNGKLSERSLRRFSFIRFFTDKLLDLIDDFCLQSARYEERFLKLGVPKEKMHVTGNLKLDSSPAFLPSEEKKKLRDELGISAHDPLIVVGSTHDPEEKDLLDALHPLFEKLPNLKVILVPRHPERFVKVAAEISARHPLLLYSERAKKRGNERVILVDAMGLLASCYQIADLAIVGGSFVRDVGGHNIFEPVQVGVPVIFGPHMHKQLDIVQLVLHGRSGKQVSLSELPDLLTEWLLNRNAREETQKQCVQLAREAQGALARTLERVKRRC